MYYRYRSKRSKKIGFKLIFFILIITGSCYWFYQNKDMLFFWKFNINKINNQINYTLSEQDLNNKIKKLKNINELCEKYKADNPLEDEAYFISAKINFLIGENMLKKSFNNLFEYNEINIEDPVRKLFIVAIKNTRKGISLQLKSKPDDDKILILSKSLFYTRYSKLDIIFKWLNKIRKPDLLQNEEDKKFYGFINILSGDYPHGIEYLKRNINLDQISGKIFIARIYSKSRQYTNAILEYKSLLEKTSNQDKLWLIHNGLGDVYLKQLLYKEALFHYAAALNLKKDDIKTKIIIAGINVKTGKKQAARVLLSEILKNDQNNIEAKELMKIL